MALFSNRWRRIGLFDGFVIAGGLVNVIVVVALVAYWIAH